MNQFKQKFFKNKINSKLLIIFLVIAVVSISAYGVISNYENIVKSHSSLVKNLELDDSSKDCYLMAHLLTHDIFCSNYAFGSTGSDHNSRVTVENVRTVPGDMKGTFEHFVKICAGENNRLERPNVIISSDIESFREQLFVNIPPNSCSHHGFTVNAEDPNSISVEIIDSRNF